MNFSQQPARVRFAPSPTGHLHLGGARTALFDFLIAQQTGGQFILRIEDTDRRRYVEGAEQELMNSLKWLGIQWDEGPDIGGPHGPYRQSEKKDIYLKYAEQLIDSGHAYYCFCTPEKLEKKRQEQIKNKENPLYDGTCRNLNPAEAKERVRAGEKHVIRFKTPKEGKTIASDLLRGDIAVENKLLDDFILVKSDGWALYHLAAMVDDHEMEITHVIRGAEWLPTFPLHTLIYRAFGWQEPAWVHLSVFLKPSGKGKMSKREAADLIKDGHSIFIKELEKLGYVPEGVNNWIALMGWSLDDRTEFFKLTDLIHTFSLNRLNLSPAAINFTKLDHFNSLHVRDLEANDLAERLLPFFKDAGYQADVATLMKLVPILKPRLTTLDDAIPMAGFFFKDVIIQDPAFLIAKGTTPQQSLEIVQLALAEFDRLNTVQVSETESAFRTLVESSSFTPGQFFGVMREAITGQRISPPLFESIEVIGLDVTKQRLKQAVMLIQSMVQS